MLAALLYLLDRAQESTNTLHMYVITGAAIKCNSKLPARLIRHLNPAWLGRFFLPTRLASSDKIIVVCHRADTTIQEIPVFLAGLMPLRSRQLHEIYMVQYMDLQ